MTSLEIYEQPMIEVVEMELQAVIAESGDGEVTNPDPGKWN